MPGLDSLAATLQGKMAKEAGVPYGHQPAIPAYCCTDKAPAAQTKGVATPGGGRSSLAAALQGAMASESEPEDWRAEGRAAAGNAQVERSAPPSRFERMKVWANRG